MFYVDEVNIIFDTKKYCTFFAIKNLNNSLNTKERVKIKSQPQIFRCIKTNFVFTILLITARLFCPLRLHGFPLARIPIGQTGGLKTHS